MEINDESFEKEVLESKKLVMVDFWAPWCMPCQMLKPVVEEIAKEVEEKASVKTMNVDESPKTSEKYNIRSIPAVLFFKDGEVVKEVIGIQSKENYKEVIEELA